MKSNKKNELGTTPDECNIDLSERKVEFGHNKKNPLIPKEIESPSTTYLFEPTDKVENTKGKPNAK